MSSNLNNNKLIILVFSFVIILVSNPFILTDAEIISNKPIRVGFPLWVPDLLAFVAQDKGFFKKNNVDVNLTLIPKYNDAINAYTNRDYDGIFAVYSDFIIQQSEGINTKVVYGVDYSNTADAIVGIGTSLLDVKGKNISIVGINTFSHYFVLRALDKVGLTEGDVQFVNMPFQNVTTSLQKGQIFAGHTYAPFVSDAIKKGFKVLYTGAEVPIPLTDVIAFHSDIVQQRPQDIQNIVKSLAEAKADYDKNKEQDISIMAARSGLNREQINEGINNVNLLGLGSNVQNSMNKTSINLTSMYVSGNNIAKFYSERGVISEYPNIDDLVDPQFVNTLFKKIK
ncbi:MAG: ABC transporter substrate-binding protein [Candidatus Nitrosocosmicus sp.]